MEFLLLVVLVVALLACPHAAFAYIGPGAGFAFLGSTFVLVLAFFLALSTIFLWPLRLVRQKLKRTKRLGRAKVKRVVIVGLDGLEPSLVEKYIGEGALPNMAKLKEEGHYTRLGTTLPALSPVAWSSFQTGVNPGAHNIFDFLTRDKRRYLPLLASTETSTRLKRFGPWKKTTSSVNITRKSKPFWKLLGDCGVFSNIVRVPISYPPEKFNGNILSAMCTPDLRGTQGTFSYFSSSERGQDKAEGGEFHHLKKDGRSFKGKLIGPPDPKGGDTAITFTLSPNGTGKDAYLDVGTSKIKLNLNEFSPWVELNFVPSRGPKISGIGRFCLRGIGDETSLYVTPINVNPEKPALPISEPVLFSNWLAKKQGLFGTLGLMEDTWGRNELALDDARFLEQSYLTHAEREKMFFESLECTREGVCACVFDASDRIQHMFWRYLDSNHPSPLESDTFKQVIPEMYQKMDALVGSIRERMNPQDALIVLSDHGFASFRRGVNLNSWLKEQGLLTLKKGSLGSDYLRDVDWSKTKAFALGLSGIYINLLGREAEGIVDEDSARALKIEIASKLQALIDPASGKRAVSKVYDSHNSYKGLYVDEAPDLIVGYNPGYRVSWDSVTGSLEPQVFSDNIKAWSGDHHVDPALIPGVLFTNRRIGVKDPHIMDIAPTVLGLFGAPIPEYFEGRNLME